MDRLDRRDDPTDLTRARVQIALILRGITSDINCETVNIILDEVCIKVLRKTTGPSPEYA